MIKTLFKELKEYKLPSVITPLCMIGEVVCEMIIPIMMARIVDEGIYGGDMGVIFRTGGIMFIIAILGLISGIGGAYFGANASAGFAKNLRKAMFDNIQTFSFANIDKFSTSGLVTRLTTDVSNIQNAYMMMLRMAMRAPASLIIAMIAAFTISPRIARIYLIAVIFLSIIMVLVMGRTTRFFKQVFEKYDSLNESVQENVSAIRVVKAYVREEHENTKFQKAAENIYRLFVRAEMNMVYVSPLMTATVYVCILLVSWVGAHMVVAGDISTGNLMSLLTYCMSILMSLMFLAMIFVMMTMASASGKRIAEVIEEKSSITNKADPVMNVRDGSISFEHVSFAYNEESEEPVLKDINLEINAGETIGIIGGTGSAKSSLVNLISRLYDVSKGTVRVGGVDVRDYDLETLRDQVSVVLQKNVLFSGTIIDNLRWGDKNATEEDCKRVCRMACADEFIEKMPDGYNTVIEQGGANVSGGQRQRLCIARALLKKPKILILDDSTSAVDTSTDARIRKAFAEEIPGTTKLIIAQRISSVQDCDRIIVMDDGKINGFGTHKELLESNDIYREVYESQTGASGDADFDSPVAQ
ncbi:ABC transporter ATP-binding/permease protein [Butyrivibrio proteoclasticus B316]|uniref:ABC transporter ATP-binding/permease protein n=1 Tax=Butyrivibrio proteoclasticus (strain ATCC 51982 / DSM 14932 / B316) TaxID=515622 RepID=E0RVF5_BUTPB|nr:ABC transporter ATP-binding protein [Butyrivibrio proteoclasticus]ADL34804.1 ABC transporter ATP-binding/permease protein [Butyrivibrio proteoclasticus B316]